MKKLAALAAACIALGGLAAPAHSTPRDGHDGDACSTSPAPAKARIRERRLVRIRAVNDCPTQVLWISWNMNTSSDSQADVLIVHPGARFDWDAADLEHLSRIMRFPRGADHYNVGWAEQAYCFDVEGAAFEVSTDGVRPGNACPWPPED